MLFDGLILKHSDTKLDWKTVKQNLEGTNVAKGGGGGAHKGPRPPIDRRVKKEKNRELVHTITILTYPW